MRIPRMSYNEPRMGCPFDYRLARTPYLVLPKLAIQSMPMGWRRRFEEMLQEMDDTGMSTPNYQVFRDDGLGEPFTRATCVNESTGFVKVVRGQEDPWANYRHGRTEEICPDYKRPFVAAPEPVERRPSQSHIWVPGWDGEFGYFRDAIDEKVVCTSRGYEGRRGVVRKHCTAHDTFGIDQFPDFDRDTGLLWMKRGSFKFDDE
jgi:hypothetical protein